MGNLETGHFRVSTQLRSACLVSSATIKYGFLEILFEWCWHPMQSSFCTEVYEFTPSIWYLEIASKPIHTIPLSYAAMWVDYSNWICLSTFCFFISQNSIIQPLQINVANLTPFWKQLLFDNHNLRKNLHLLVKRWCQKGHCKGSKKGSNVGLFADFFKNPRSFQINVHISCGMHCMEGIW